MGIVRLGPNGEVTVIEPCTPEEEARANEAVLEIARALGRMLAEQEWKRHLAERKAALSAAQGDPKTS